MAVPAAESFRRLDAKSGSRLVAALFFLFTTCVSYLRWENFQYRTFDLAYYVQALWQLLHGSLEISVLGLSLLGNHVEPVVFLFAPLFWLAPQPMLLVAIQNAALASICPVAYRIGTRLGLPPASALVLCSAALLTPAAGYIALHEFHPEALAAPCLLLMFNARLSASLRAHWGWLLATLACKENLALLVVGYCVVFCVVERKRAFAELRAWYLWPMAAAAGWFLLCSQVITPSLNAGNIDYGALYDRLGHSPREMAQTVFLQPLLIWRLLAHAVWHGNLVWGLLLPFLFLPLLRLRWLVISLPIFLQHLLSWRSSEWTIYFHYAAPLLPLIWIATAEAVAARPRWRTSRLLPCTILLACLISQAFFGPARAAFATFREDLGPSVIREQRNALLAQIPANASVVAPLPYLSHLAKREKLYSLHFVLKGLKTLSRETYEPPPPPDFVLIDYGDDATLDPIAGYYHPWMKVATGRIVPSSDRLLHDFLRCGSWKAESVNQFTLLRRESSPERPQGLLTDGEGTQIAPGAKLLDVTLVLESERNERTPRVKTRWLFAEPREVFPWLDLVLTRTSDQRRLVATRGLCAPEAGAGEYIDSWTLTLPDDLPQGEYLCEALFFDNTKRVWAAQSGEPQGPFPPLAPPVSIGRILISPPPL